MHAGVSLVIAYQNEKACNRQLSVDYEFFLISIAIKKETKRYHKKAKPLNLY
jgi:hypothetical protein